MSKDISISILEFGERIDLCLCCGGRGGGGVGGSWVRLLICGGNAK